MNLGSSEVLLNTVDILRNTAIVLGGGLYAVHTRIIGQSCNLKENHADEYGGSLYMKSSTIRANESILESNVAPHGGGGYLINSSLVVQDSIVKNNLATYGGATNLQRTRGDFLNTTFTNNSAFQSGGSLHIEQSWASIQECVFENGTADSGGLLFLSDAPYVNISHSMLKDSNAKWGGCLYNRGGNITIHNATMHGCQASASGGAVSMINSATAIIAHSSFVSNNASHGAFLALDTATVTGDMLIVKKNEASERGGAIYGMNNTLHLSNSLFKENSARYAGAICQQRNVASVFSNVTFVNNWAISSGGSLFSEESVLNLNHCLLRNSSAENGGLLFSWRDVLNITESDLMYGSAQEGGCASATEANLTFWRTSFQNCSASKDSGGLYIKEGSSLQLINSSIEGNRAADNGGGLSCMLGSVVHLEDSTVKNNSAQSGGAMDVRLNTTGDL